MCDVCATCVRRVCDAEHIAQQILTHIQNNNTNTLYFSEITTKEYTIATSRIWVEYFRNIGYTRKLGSWTVAVFMPRKVRTSQGRLVDNVDPQKR